MDAISLGKSLGKSLGISDGNISPITGNLIIGLLGDSRAALSSYVVSSADNFENVGLCVAWNFKLNNRFEFSHNLNKGVSGDKMSDILARLSDIDALVQTYGATDILFILGTNDFSNGTSIEDLTSGLDTVILRTTVTNSARIILVEETPREDLAGEAVRIAYNALMRSKSKNNPLVKLIPIPSAWDATTGEDTVDGVHDSPRGCFKRAISAINNLPEYGALGSLTEKITIGDGGAIDGDFSGTSGNLNSLASGVLSDGWNVQDDTDGGTANPLWVTFSKTEEDHLKADINIPQGSGSAVGIYIYKNYIAISGVEVYEAKIEYDVEIISGKLVHAVFEMREESPTNIYHSAFDDRAGSGIPSYGSGIAAVPLITTNGTNTRLRPRFVIKGDATDADIVGTIIFKAASVVKIP